MANPARLGLLPLSTESASMSSPKDPIPELWVACGQWRNMAECHQRIIGRPST